jgi:hypothetical protein
MQAERAHLVQGQQHLAATKTNYKLSFYGVRFSCSRPNLQQKGAVLVFQRLRKPVDDAPENF